MNMKQARKLHRRAARAARDAGLPHVSFRVFARFLCTGDIDAVGKLALICKKSVVV